MKKKIVYSNKYFQMEKKNEKEKKLNEKEKRN